MSDQGQLRPLRPLSGFSAVKHSSWKGKYKRLFVIGDSGMATLHPSTFEETNRWEFADEFANIMPNPKSDVEFIVTTRKGKKGTNTVFSAEHRTELLTEAQRHRRRFCGGEKVENKVFSAYKLHWSESRKEVLLAALPSSLAQVGTDGKIIKQYDYNKIEAICLVSDYPGGFVIFHGGYSRMHLFALEQRDELLQRVAKSAQTYVGIPLSPVKKTITVQQFRTNRLGKYSNDLAVTSLAEFPINKITKRQPDPVPRILCLSETCILERDPGSYSVVTCRPLSSVFCIVRSPKDPQLFQIEYMSGDIRSYLSTERESLLASLLDSVRAQDNKWACIQILPTSRGNRYQPRRAATEEETESALLKFIGTRGDQAGMNFALAVHRFNSNIAYSGIVHAVTAEGWFKENKEKLIIGALNQLLEKGAKSASDVALANEFLAIRRLVATKAGFHAFTQLPEFKERIGGKIVKALQRDDDGVTSAALDMLCTLMQPMHDNFDLGQERINKTALLGSKAFVGKLLQLLKRHADAGTGALVVSQLLDFFTFALCAPYSETTDAEQFDMVLAMVADLGRSLFHLFSHPSMAIVKAAGLIMKTIIEEGTPEMCADMQAMALAEGALLSHLQTSLFTQSTDSRLLMHRQLSRHLVGLWMEQNPTATALFARMLPAGLVTALSSEEVVPEKEADMIHQRTGGGSAVDPSAKVPKKKLAQLATHWRQRFRKSEQAVKPSAQPVVLRRRRQRVKIQQNWDYFYWQFGQDHARADLIWNYKTREELREAVENELRAFMSDKDLRGKFIIAWNHTEFEVHYETLAEEVKIGDHFLRLLLENDPGTATIHNPPEFFNDLYHRFLLTTRPAMKSMCLQAMTVVYGRCYDQIGHFNDTEYIVTMLSRCEDKMERDRLLQFLQVLLNNDKNVKLFIDAGGVRCLVDLVTLAHLHTNRATVPMQTLMLEGSASQMSMEEAEWYYNDGGTKQGPLTLSDIKELFESGKINKETKMWAQGMEAWRIVRQIPQLKWTLCSTGTGVMDPSQLSAHCLDMLIAICKLYPSRDRDGAVVRPIPRCKRMLADATCLSHIVQLLLTFDPAIVERVADLLSIIMQDNSQMPRLYLTGVFYFIMMYTGSNLLPVARFLRDTHGAQAYQSEVEGLRSVLAPMLPKAMVCYLDNYGPEKFASIFLGEFDTPEAIWGAEMRRLLIEKIALHLADFTPRLLVNNRALYTSQYCPIPKVSYPELEDELFCNIYYLRHLCNEERFPDWEIKNHVELLKDILNAWKVEVEKKPPEMNVGDACEVLGLESIDGLTPAKIRKAYFKMSMKYHPDKNPEGRDMFEKVNKAYEFISSKEAQSAQGGPKAENIVLILRAQSILFKRHSDVLKPYKYAGYPMLMVTLERETVNDQLFAGQIGVLAAACELAHWTVRCSPLNAEEMRRDGGVERLMAALARCCSVIMKETSDDEPAVQVCISILKCFSCMAQFDECREKITENPNIMKDLCRCLWYEGSHKLTNAAVECVAALSIDTYLQNHLLNSGVIWHLILRLFGYDYTLDESGVEKDDETHKQEFTNRNAKMAAHALARLGGYRKGSNATPPNPTVQDALNGLLTKFLADQLSNDNPVPLLKAINANTEDPYLIWDNSTRSELSDYVEDQQESVIKTGEQDADYGTNFVFSAHRDEVKVAGVYVRIYNEQPSFVLRNPKEFTMALINFIGNKAQYLWSAELVKSSPSKSPAPPPAASSSSGGGDLIDLSGPSVFDSEAKDATTAAATEGGGEEDMEAAAKKAAALAQVCLALESLRNVIKANPGVELCCNGSFKMLFSLLRQKDVKLQMLALEVVNAVTGNKECVKNIASSQVLVFMLMTLRTLPTGRSLCIETLHALMSNAKCIIELVQRGGLLYLLDTFCNGANMGCRESTAALFAKMLTEKLHGPKIRIILSKFMPAIFMDAMRDSPEASVITFEGQHENPELIWNEDARAKVEGVVRDMTSELFDKQKENPSLVWRLPENFAVVYEQVAGEVVVGGVFLRLLIKQPNWSFRKPKEFLVALMEKYVQLISKKAPTPDDLEAVEVVTEAVVMLLMAQSDLAAHVPSLGHIHKMVECMGRNNAALMSSCLCVLNQLMGNVGCVRAISGSAAAVPAIMKAMKVATPSALPAGCEMIKKVYETGNVSALIRQALDCKFPDFLLKLLREGLDTVEHPSATKAHVVKALKAMTRDLSAGDEVAAVLNACGWWATYKEQKHDLFIGSNQTAGYLTGPTTASVAGYLTAAPANVAGASAPPPVEDSAAEPVRKSANALD